MNETFDRTWAGPEDMKPRAYRSQREKDIWYSCVVENEYRLPPLQPADTVIDIGAHIGGFTWLAHRMGSRRIYAYETDPWHMEAGRINLEGLEGISYQHCAVVRSDELRAPAYFYGGNWNVWEAKGSSVPSVSLDEILRQHGPVRFLKIDCEGSEWPILYTCSQLSAIQEIAGEYHTRRLGQLEYPELRNLPPCEPKTLIGFLSAQGFNDIACTSENEAELGLFHAART